MTDSSSFLRSVPLFAGLSEEAFEQIAGLALEVEWEAGRELLADGERALYVVREGEVEIYSVIGGIERLFMTVQPGED